MNKRVILFCLLLPLLTLAAENGILLQWEGVENHTYQIELQKNETPLFIERLSQPEVTLDLSPGSYSYRITFFNKFDKPDAQTEWIELTVIKDLEPVIIDIPEHSIFAGDRPQKLDILVADIMEGAEIFLEKDGTSYTPLFEKKSLNRIELTLDTENLAPGEYDIHIINPSGSETLLSKGIILKEKRNPQIEDMERHSAFAGEQIPRINVYGKGFDPDLVAFLERDGKRYRLPMNDYRGEQEISLWFNLSGLEPGQYNLVLINPPLEETVLTDAFTIIEPKAVRDDVFYENIPWGIDLLIGFPLPDVIFDTALTNYTFTDGDGLISPFPEIELNLRTDLNRNNFLLKYFGWEGRFAFFPPVDQGIFFNTMEMGLYGRTRFTFPLNFFLEGLMGYRWMRMDVDDSSVSAAGTVLTYGMGLTINYDRFLIDLCARRDAWIMEQDYVSVNQITLRFGHRF